MEQGPKIERFIILQKTINNKKPILYQVSKKVPTKKRFINLQKSEIALYKKLSANVTLMFFIICIIFFVNVNNSIISIFFLS